MPRYIEGFDEFREGQDIQHYGRLGMKWYQHKYGEEDGRARYLDKGLKKMEKMDTKIQSRKPKIDVYKEKAQMKKDKAQVYRDKFEWTGKTKYMKKAAKQNRKSYKFNRKAYKLDMKNSKLLKKGRKMTKFINQEYGMLKTSDLNSEQIRIGRQFALDILEDRNRVA